jgi:NADH-quinone oxidoreductase subunit H
MTALLAIFFFPTGLSLLILALAYDWARRKLVALMQARVGPRWFQPLADTIKLLAKEEVLPTGVDRLLFVGLPVVALAGVLTAALYTPIFGLPPAFNFTGDIIVTVYLLSLVTLCIGMAGSNTIDRFSLVGATRALTQLFSYEAPFLLAMLTPAIAAGSWQIDTIVAYTSTHLLLVTQPITFVVAILGLMGKLELPPFDSPEAETEIVAGSFTEYSGRGFALFRLARQAALVVGLTLVAAFYLGGVGNPLLFFIKTLGLLVILALIQVSLTRLRIDQTVHLWWRFGALLALGQLLVTLLMQGGTV